MVKVLNHVKSVVLRCCCEVNVCVFCLCVHVRQTVSAELIEQTLGLQVTDDHRHQLRVSGVQRRHRDARRTETGRTRDSGTSETNRTAAARYRSEIPAGSLYHAEETGEEEEEEETRGNSAPSKGHAATEKMRF